MSAPSDFLIDFQLYCTSLHCNMTQQECSCWILNTCTVELQQYLANIVDRWICFKFGCVWKIEMGYPRYLDLICFDIFSFSFYNRKWLTHILHTKSSRCERMNQFLIFESNTESLWLPYFTMLRLAFSTLKAAKCERMNQLLNKSNTESLWLPYFTMLDSHSPH